MASGADHVRIGATALLHWRRGEGLAIFSAECSIWRTGRLGAGAHGTELPRFFGLFSGKARREGRLRVPRVRLAALRGLSEQPRIVCGASDSDQAAARYRGAKSPRLLHDVLHQLRSRRILPLFARRAVESRQVATGTARWLTSQSLKAEARLLEARWMVTARRSHRLPLPQVRRAAMAWPSAWRR